MRHSNSLLNYIKHNFDYDSYIRENCDYKVASGFELRTCCPYCYESDYKFYINTDINCFNCFKCNTNNGNSSLFNLIAKIENISIKAAIDKLALQFRHVTPEELSLFDRDGEIEITDNSPSFLKVKYIEGLPKDAVLLSFENEDTIDFCNYLYGRGFTMQDITDCQIHYIAKPNSFIYKEGKIKGNIGRRIIWPVYGGDHKLVSWVARCINPSLPKHIPKYINAPDSDQSKTFWPFVLPKDKHVVLVEGIIDSFSVRKTGYSAYATFGKHISEEQISILQYWGVEEVTVFLDQNAKKEIISAVSKLRLLFKKINVVDVSNWPKNEDKSDKDSGSMLAYSGGIDILTKSLDSRINILQEMEYTKWQLM